MLFFWGGECTYFCVYWTYICMCPCAEARCKITCLSQSIYHTVFRDQVHWIGGHWFDGLVSSLDRLKIFMSQHPEDMCSFYMASDWWNWGPHAYSANTIQIEWYPHLEPLNFQILFSKGPRKYSVIIVLANVTARYSSVLSSIHLSTWQMCKKNHTM